MDNILTYKDVLNNLSQKRFLLIGNGFSMSYDFERFSFKSLLESAVNSNLIDKKSPLYDIFIDFATKDFEEVVKLLENSVKVAEKYGAISDKNREIILKDSKNLKKHLVEIITNNHPQNINEVSYEEFQYSTKFIKEYNKVFTLNYDLLLYWTTIKLKYFIDQKKVNNSILVPKDGFGKSRKGKDYIVFSNDNSSQEIYYLHGALHIFDNKSSIVKNTYSKTEIPLKEQTLRNLEKDIYPIFVSEGTSEQKKTKIIHNAYLNHCYKNLASLGTGHKNSSLVIFGTLLKENDAHIREAILKNRVKNIYFGVGSKEEIEQLQLFKSELEDAKQSKNVYFYDYRTVKVWRD